MQSFVTCHWSIPSVHLPRRPGERNTDQRPISPYSIYRLLGRQVMRINRPVSKLRQREVFLDYGILEAISVLCCWVAHYSCSKNSHNVPQPTRTTILLSKGKPIGTPVPRFPALGRSRPVFSRLAPVANSCFTSWLVLGIVSPRTQEQLAP